MTSAIPVVPPELQAILESPHVPQKGMDFNPAKWRKSVGDLAGVTLDFEALSNPISRADLCGFVDAQLNARKVTDAFVAVMIWGYGKSARGRSRTRLILTGGERDGKQRNAVDDSVVARLTESARLARADVSFEDAARDAYFFLNNRDEGGIKQLGPSFFTKWLYATSSRGDCDNPQAAPILDRVVRRWMNSQANANLRRGKTDDYVRYTELLKAWGGDLRTPAQTEQAIFEFARAGS